jgi:hypothetical protein
MSPSTVKPVPRKPPAKRLFSGMAGSPLAQVNELQAEPIVAPAVAGPFSIGKKRGPKPKGDRPMTAAERQRKKRGKDSEPEKRNLVASIIRTTKRGLMTASRAKAAKESVREENRIRLRRLRDDLMLLSVVDLRKYAETLKDAPDSRGRLHGENHSGEPKRDENSPIEKIIAAQERDEHGHKVKPKGYGPASFDHDIPAASAPEFSPEKSESEERVENAIEKTLGKIFTDRLSEPVQCLWCQTMLATPIAAENHLYTEYAKAKSQKEYLKTLEAYISVPDNFLEAARKALRDNLHFKGINELIREKRKQEREWKKKAKAAGFRPALAAWDTKVIDTWKTRAE